MPAYGRLIDHVHLRVADLARARAFYRAVLDALGRGGDMWERDDAFGCDELYVDAAGPEGRSRVHLAFQAATHDAVRAFHGAGLAAGGTDNGAPGPRDYHAQYFAAFLLDPDGNNVEALCEAPVERSADAVIVRRTGAAA